MDKCPSCGKEIQDGIRFCPGCGADVTAPVNEPEPEIDATPEPEAETPADGEKKPGFRARISTRIEKLVYTLTHKTSFVISISVFTIALMFLVLIVSGNEPGIPRISYIDVDKAINITGGTENVTELEDIEKTTKIYDKYQETIDKIIASAGFEDVADKKQQLITLTADLPLEGQKRFLRGLESTIELAQSDNPGIVESYATAYIDLFASEYELSKQKTGVMRETLVKIVMMFCAAVFVFLLLTVILAVMRMDANIKALKDHMINTKD